MRATIHTTVLLVVLLLTAVPTVPTVLAGPPTDGRPDFMRKLQPGQLRVMCYNINWDSIFPANDPHSHKYRRHQQAAQFVRVLRAIQPDIVCLQEINPDRDPSDVAAILDAALPQPAGGKWNVYLGRDNAIAAPYPLTMCASDTEPTTDRGQAMALIDLPDATYRYDLYMINAHTKSAGGEENIRRRENHGDAIVNWIRDLRTPGGAADLPAHTPIVILGDLNVYPTDTHRHLNTLITGDILNEAVYGTDFKPDWDDSDLHDTLPHHNLTGAETYTWRDDTGQFEPYPLDRIIFTDSVMSAAKAFILDTTTMFDAQLAAAGLQAGDVALDLESGYFDHFPLVVDFSIPGHATGDANGNGRLDATDFNRFIECYNAAKGAASHEASPECVAAFDFDEDADVDLDDFNRLQGLFSVN